MRNPPQRRLDTTNNNWCLRVGLAHALRIHKYRAIGALASRTLRCVRIITAHAPIRGVVIDQGIHIAGGDTKKERGLAEFREIIQSFPVRLGNDPDPKSLRLQ